MAALIAQSPQELSLNTVTCSSIWLDGQCFRDDFHMNTSSGIMYSGIMCLIGFSVVRQYVFLLNIWLEGIIFMSIYYYVHYTILHFLMANNNIIRYPIYEGVTIVCTRYNNVMDYTIKCLLFQEYIKYYMF